MNKRTLAAILLLLGVVAVVYAIYKGMEITATTIEAGRTLVSGQPQHGLTLGLCVFGGFCVLAASLLYWDDRYGIHSDGHHNSTATTTTSNKVATNYPR